MKFDPPNRRHLRRPEPLGQIVHEDGDTRESSRGIASHGHRCRPGMVRLPREGHAGPRDPLHTGDRSDPNALRLKHRTLLDMQLDEGVRNRTRTRSGPEVPDAIKFGANRWPRSAWISGSDVVGLLDRHPARVHEASKHVRGESGPSSSVKKLTPSGRRNSTPAARTDSITSSPASTPRLPSNRPPVATVSICEPHRTGGRPDRCPQLSPHHRDHIADRIDRHVEPEVAHPAHHQIATVAVCVGQGEARAPSLAGCPGDRANLGEGLKTLQETPTVDVDTHERRLRVA